MENATSASVREQWDGLRLSYSEATDTATAALDACNESPNDADAIARLKAAAKIEGNTYRAVMEADAPDLGAVLWKLEQLFTGNGLDELGCARPHHRGFTDKIMADMARLNVAAKDTAILDAWGRRSIAYALYNAANHDPDNLEPLTVVDTAENDIRKAVATTPLRVEIPLWTALFHTDLALKNADAEALNIMDLDHFMATEGDWDWKDRLILAAVNSLRAMRAGGAA